MNFNNPTLISLGISGTFGGHPYRVAGRTVMGVVEDGETYYWNEFNLVGSDGRSADLVYEETERGPAWRLFTLFEPQSPMSVAEAASKRVGDAVNLDGKAMRVTLVEESRVYHIEGEAPEGVEVGDVARYFNAEAGNAMVVVSWTGDEIEFYHGLDLPGDAVASAFGLPRAAPAWTPRSAASSSVPAGAAGKLVGAFLAGMALLAAYCFWQPSRSRSTVSRPAVPAAPLPVGAVGKLNGVTCNLASHALVDIAQVGLRYAWHEYHFFDDNERRALLVYGAKPGAKDWIMYTPFPSEKALTAQEAAAKGLGDKVDLDGARASVASLFRARICRKEGQDWPGLANGTVLFCFTAQTGTNQFLVRWNTDGIQFYRGKIVPAKEVVSGFGKNAGR